jgi:hypothetical protein
MEYIGHAWRNIGMWHKFAAVWLLKLTLINCLVYYAIEIQIKMTNVYNTIPYKKRRNKLNVTSNNSRQKL